MRMERNHLPRKAPAVSIAELHEEDVQSKLLIVDDQLRVHRSVGGDLAKRAGPPLHRGERGCVEHKVARTTLLAHKAGLRLQAAHIAAVAQLRLSICGLESVKYSV